MTGESPRGARPVRVGEAVTAVIESLAFGGDGVAHVEGFAVFVRGGLPGQTVRARVLRRKSGYAEARIEEVLVHSPDELPAPCPHFGPCGGCLWQNLEYGRQLEAKARQVRDCLVRIGGQADPPLEAPLACTETYRYRNKLEFSFADRVWRADAPVAGEAAPAAFGLGLHVRGRFDKVLDQRECHLMAPWAAAAAVTVRRAARDSGLPPYAPRESRGFFRFLILREGIHTGQRMVVLITYPPADERERIGVERTLEAVRREHPDVTSLVHGTTASKASVAVCQQYRVIHGPDTILERLLDDEFEIGPDTFFQTNTRQAEKLFERALGFVTGTPRLVYDLYCGVGALTLPLSRRAERVIGVELVEASVENARRNAARNGRENVEFLASDIRRALTPRGLCDATGAAVAGVPDLIVVDPPRDGLHPDVVRGIAALVPPRILYVSCNPSTLARDSALLAAEGFRLDRAVPVDMFPQTAHVEVVASFTTGPPPP